MAKKKEKQTPAGLMIPGGIFIGLGIGFYTGNVPMWLFLGLGAGFILMALTLLYQKKK